MITTYYTFREGEFCIVVTKHICSHIYNYIYILCKLYIMIHILYGRVGIAPTRDCAHAGLHPHGIALTRDCTHTGLHPRGIAPTRDCTHTGLRPHGIAPTRDCAHAGLRLHGIASTSLSLSLYYDYLYFILFSFQNFVVISEGFVLS